MLTKVERVAKAWDRTGMESSPATMNEKKQIAAGRLTLLSLSAAHIHTLIGTGSDAEFLPQATAYAA